MPIIEFIGSKFRGREKRGWGWGEGGIAKQPDVQYLPDNRTGIAVKGSFLSHSSPEKSERNVRFSQLSHFKLPVRKLLIYLRNLGPFFVDFYYTT